MSQEQLNASPRKILGVIVSSLLAINGALAGVAVSSGVEVSPFVFFGLAIAAIIAQNVKDKFALDDDKTAYKGAPE